MYAYVMIYDMNLELSAVSIMYKIQNRQGLNHPQARTQTHAWAQLQLEMANSKSMT